MTQEEVNKIFERWQKFINEEYVPDGTPVEEPPKYTPTPKSAGPKPITIQQYRERQQKHREQRQKIKQQQKPTPTPKKKGGKKKKFLNECWNLQRIINISEGKQKTKLIQELIKLKNKGWK